MYPRFLLAVFVVLCGGQALGCTITGFVQIKMMERLMQSTYVVYGRTIWHSPTKVMVNGNTEYVVDATYEVHCIFKEGEDPMNEEIIISQISPAPDCFGTDVTSYLKVGDYSIIALKNTTGGKYVLEEVMPELSAAFSPTKPYIFTLANLCGMQAWKSPEGATTNKCPICGISNFASEVTTLGGTGLVNCEFTTNGVVSSSAACDLFIAGSISYANSQTCVPASYNQTCVDLQYTPSTATCDCQIDNNDSNVGTADGIVHLPNRGIILLLVLFLYSVG